MDGSGTGESALRFLSRPRVFKRNLVIALVVGTVLSVVNHPDALVSGKLSPTVLVKILFNFLIPFAVASVSCALNRSGSDG